MGARPLALDGPGKAAAPHRSALEGDPNAPVAIGPTFSRVLERGIFRDSDHAGEATGYLSGYVATRFAALFALPTTRRSEAPRTHPTTEATS